MLPPAIRVITFYSLLSFAMSPEARISRICFYSLEFRSSVKTSDMYVFKCEQYMQVLFLFSLDPVDHKGLIEKPELML